MAVLIMNLIMVSTFKIILVVEILILFLAFSWSGNFRSTGWYCRIPFSSLIHCEDSVLCSSAVIYHFSLCERSCFFFFFHNHVLIDYVCTVKPHTFFDIL